MKFLKSIIVSFIDAGNRNYVETCIHHCRLQRLSLLLLSWYACIRYYILSVQCTLRTHLRALKIVTYTATLSSAPTNRTERINVKYTVYVLWSVIYSYTSAVVCVTVSPSEQRLFDTTALVLGGMAVCVCTVMAVSRSHRHIVYGNFPLLHFFFLASTVCTLFVYILVRLFCHTSHVCVSVQYIVMALCENTRLYLHTLDNEYK